MAQKVIAIIDGNTFQISPGWKFKEEEGHRVRIANYNTPEKGQPGYSEARTKLSSLILYENVELKNPVNLSYGRLVCDVYLNGTDIKKLL
jgi:endonuclease YncB( thermonuclease family)